MSRIAKRQSRPPTLPQHELPPPYSRLLTLGMGEFEREYEQIARELKAGDVNAAVRKLLEIALDESYYEYWSEKNQDDPRVLTRVHAVSVLAKLGSAAEIAIEPFLALLNEEDDWLREEMPFFYAAMGEVAIEPLADLLLDPESDADARITASDSLTEIVEKHPTTRAQVVSILEKTLSEDKEDKETVGFVISNLLDLDAKESVPLIQQAFQEERVDEMILQLADVEEYFGLPRTAQRKDWDEILNNLEQEDGIYWGEDAADNEEEPEDGMPELLAPSAPQTPYVAPVKVGRNDPCPCGSGKKYKKCHGA